MCIRDRRDARGRARARSLVGDPLQLRARPFSLSLFRYVATRKVQGRLNDVLLVAASHAEREGGDPAARCTARASALLETTARHVRLFNVLLYASLSRKYAPLGSPQGLEALQRNNALTAAERERLLQASMPRSPGRRG